MYFLLFADRPSVDRRTWKGSVLCNQHHAEASLALHHASVGIRSLFERNGLDHRADILEDTEGQGVLGLNGRAGQ
jgi:hypothetical protein